MRRGIAATALVASFALAATACGGSDSGDKADGPVTITWWDTSNATNEAPTYQALIKEFEAANKDIKVKYVNVPFDQAQNKFDTAAGSKRRPRRAALRGRLDPRLRQEGLPRAARRHRGPRRPGQVPAQPDRAGQVRGQDLRRPVRHRHPRPGLQQGALREGRRRGPQDLGRPEDGRRHDQGRRPASTATGAPPRPTTPRPSSTARAPTPSTPPPRRSRSTRPPPRRPTAPGSSLFDGKGLHKADTTADAYAHIQDAFVNGKVAAIVQGPWEITNFYKGSAFKDKNNLGIATVPAGSTGKAGAPTGGHNLSVYAGSDAAHQKAALEVRQLHDLREVPDADRAEELHAAHPRRRLHRRGQGRPGHRRIPGGPLLRPAAPGAARVQLPAGARWTPSWSRSPAARSPWTRASSNAETAIAKLVPGLQPSDARVAAGSPGHRGRDPAATGLRPATPGRRPATPRTARTSRRCRT